MIWIDFTIIGFVLISLVIGLLRGVIKEVFSLAFWIVAIWVGMNFSRDFSRFLEPVISHPSARIAASFVSLFVITLVLGGLIGFILGERLIKQTGLTFGDRFLGMVFGCFRGVVVVAVMIVLAGLTSLPEDSWWKKSRLIPPFQSFAVWLRDHNPSGMAGYINYR
jgi:membrane protein required for colicin V production